MYTYTGSYMSNVHMSYVPAPARGALADIKVDAFSPTVVTFSGPIGNSTFIAVHNGKYSVNGTALTAEDVTGTSFSKVVIINGNLAWTETWSDGTDSILDATDYAYELTKLSGNDIFTGTRGSGQNDEIQGLGGNDRFTGYDNSSRYAERFFGGDGLDTSVYQGKISEYAINASKGTAEIPHIYDSRTVAYTDRVGDGIRVPGFYVSDRVANRDDTDVLAEVERLEFGVVEANGANRVSLDIDGNGGKAAKIVGALWGKESVENPTFVGIVLHYLDLGVSYEALLGLGLNALLGANKTNEAVANLLYTNLMGEAPTQDAKTELASYMDSGAYSQAGFARAIADLELNATNINLVGLSDTGLQYTEYVL